MVLPGVRHEMSFWFGGDRLTGDLRSPAAGGPHPVVLMVRDPDRRERDYSACLDALACAGVASFTWDRPTGDGGAESLPRRVSRQAREVLAAVERLCAVPQLDAEAVVVLGWGAGAWAAAEAVTFSDQIAGLIWACGPVDPSGPAGAYDVRPTLSGVTAPVLALFGEFDPLVPPDPTARVVREVLAGAGCDRYRTVVLRGGDHRLRVAGPYGSGRVVDGCFAFGDWPAPLTELIVDWINGQVRPEPVPAFAPPPRAPLVRVRAHSRQPIPVIAPVRQVRRRIGSAAF